MVLAGDERRANDLLAEIVVAELQGHGLTAAGWAASRVAPAPFAAALLDRVADEPALLRDGDVPLGPRALAEGPLIAATGDLDTAIERLEHAVADGDARAPLWGALARLELARVLRCRAAVGAFDPEGDAAAVRPLAQAAGLFFRAGGYRSLATRLAATLDPAPSSRPLGAPTVARLSRGANWSVGFGVMAPVTVPAAKGLLALRYLVDHAGLGVPATILDTVADGRTPAFSPASLAVAIERDGEELLVELSDEAIRTRVDKLLRRTIARLADAHPLLGDHLRGSVRIGQLCRYEPTPGSPITWRTGDGSGFASVGVSASS
jgi:hypothetical protein